MIQVLTRAIDVLEYIAREPESPSGLGEIAVHAGLNAPTCSRILKTLVTAGYVEQIAPKKGYILGPMAYALAAKGPYRKDLIRAAEPFLTALARETGETVLLAALRQGKRIVLHQAEGGQTVQVRGDRLQVFDPYQTATGRLLLATLPAADLRAFTQENGLPGERWPEARGPEAFSRALAQIRGDGLVVRNTDGNVVGIAAPVREGERVTAALGLYLPAHRFAGEHREKVIEGLRSTAEHVSERVSRRKP